MPSRLESLTAALQAVLGDRIAAPTVATGEVTIVVKPDDLLAVATTLRDAPELRFAQLIDLCGLDYGGYGKVAWSGTPLSEGGAGVPLAGGAPETDAAPPIAEEAPAAEHAAAA